MSNEITRHNPIAEKLATEIQHWSAVFDQRAAAARAGLWDSVQARLLAGAALIGLKQCCKHGEYEVLRATHFPDLPERMAQRWKERAAADLRDKELRGAVEAVLQDREDAAAQEHFNTVARAYYDARPLLQNAAAIEIRLLPEPVKRKTAIAEEAQPAKLRTPEEELALWRKLAVENWTSIFIQLEHFSHQFVFLDDFEVETQIAFLERCLHARRKWVNTAKADRDADAIAALLKPATV